MIEPAGDTTLFTIHCRVYNWGIQISYLQHTDCKDDNEDKLTTIFHKVLFYFV